MIQRRKRPLLVLAGLTLILMAGLACGITYGAEKVADKIVISQGGAYTFSGTLTETQIYVRAGDEETVTLCLAGVDITNSSGPAIYIENAGNTVILLEEGTENTVQSGTETDIENMENSAGKTEAEAGGGISEQTEAEFGGNGSEHTQTEASENSDEEELSGSAIYSRDDLAVTGEGSLAVYGYINNGIQTTNNLTIDSGVISVEAVNIGIKGKDSVTITGGTIWILSGGDGIRSNDTTGEGYGVISIEDGSFTIVSGGDGIQAETVLEISGGDFSVTTGGGSTAGSASGEADAFMPMPRLEEPGNGAEGPGGDFGGGAEGPEEEPEEGASDSGGGFGEGPGEPGGDFRKGGFGGGRGGRGGNKEDIGDFGVQPGDGAMPWDEDSRAEDSETSSKAFKSGTSIMILGGTFSVSACDDAFHSNGDLTIQGGIFSITSGDDGIHADTELIISGGEIQIEESYEGLEANQIYIEEGRIDITASDDGINANGGYAGREFEPDAASDMPNLCIYGGTVLVNADGDGLDSNGNLLIEGGTVIVNGPSDGGNGAIDSGSESGGTCIVNGGTVLALGSSGMSENFDEASGQCSFKCDLDFTYEAGDELVISDAEGNILYQFTVCKRGNSIMFSAPSLTLGESCLLTVSGQQQEIMLDSVSAAVGGGRGKFK